MLRVLFSLISLILFAEHHRLYFTASAFRSLPIGSSASTSAGRSPYVSVYSSLLLTCVRPAASHSHSLSLSVGCLYRRPRRHIQPMSSMSMSMSMSVAMTGTGTATATSSDLPKPALSIEHCDNNNDANNATATSIAVIVTLKQRLQQEMKEAMRGKDKTKLAAIKSIQAAVKQKEVDERIDVDDEMIIAIISKLVKQRKESIQNFQSGGREDLALHEQEECAFLQAYLPIQMSEENIVEFINEVVTRLGATTVKDMGKVMSEVKPALTGKADLQMVGKLLKKRLS